MHICTCEDLKNNVSVAVCIMNNMRCHTADAARFCCHRLLSLPPPLPPQRPTTVHTTDWLPSADTCYRVWFLPFDRCCCSCCCCCRAFLQLNTTRCADLLCRCWPLAGVLVCVLVCWCVLVCVRPYVCCPESRISTVRQ